MQQNSHLRCQDTSHLHVTNSAAREVALSFVVHVITGPVGTSVGTPLPNCIHVLYSFGFQISSLALR